MASDDKNLNALFPLQVCINLDRRPERWQRMQRALAAHGIGPVQRFSAVDGNNVVLPHDWIHSPGAYGCLRSHVQVVREARDAGASSVLIFEDDAVFDPDFKEKFAAFFPELPDDWDMLYFGALHKDEPIVIGERDGHMGRISKANSTFAYAIRNTVFDAFIELNGKAEHVLDMNSYILQERFNCYCFMPNLVWVESEYSDVQNRLENHWYLERSLVLFGSHVDRLLSQTEIVIARDSFLVDYYREYFAPLASIAVGPYTDLKKEFLILIDDDIYIEAMDIRANLLMCEQYDAATGYAKVIDLTAEQAEQLRATRITRGIDLANNQFSKNERRHFLTRRPITKIFESPNHALRLPGGSTNRK